MACATTDRTAGDESLTVSRSSSITCSMYGSRSEGDASVQSEPMMRADFVRALVLVVRRPRSTTGMISASEGASMRCTNEVVISASSAASVHFVGSEYAARSVGTTLLTSGLRTTAAIFSSALAPECLTLGCESFTAIASRGTTSGRHTASCLGAHIASEPISRIAPWRARHWCTSIASSTVGRIFFTPCAESRDTIDAAAADAICRTSLSVSA